jgi:hypothetical protein
MQGMSPSQRRLQSVCAVWQRVLHDWTLAPALAEAPSNTKKAASTNRSDERTP